MEAIRLEPVSAAWAAAIEDYRAEFPAERMRVTADADRIPGLDGLEDFGGVGDWLAWCRDMAGKVSWYLSVRERDGRVVGALCLRHRLEYDDDDPEFASHIGYSVRPSERRRGYAKAQLALGLAAARGIGLRRVRVICRDVNVGSRRAILANGGRFVDAITGEESGLTVNRYDIELN